MIKQTKKKKNKVMLRILYLVQHPKKSIPLNPFAKILMKTLNISK